VGEFPPAPVAAATRMTERNAGGFFWLLFFSKKEK
jgi:hypothetical protein